MNFPKGKHDDQADSISQALDWIKKRSMGAYWGLLEFWRQEAEKAGIRPRADAQ
jgi:hypothetical protein